MKPRFQLVPAGLDPGRNPTASGAPEVDRATLMRAQGGDEAACRVLVERHQRVVFATISRVVGAGVRQSLVPDLAQETFLRVFRQLGRFEPDGPGRLSSWISTIAARVALDECKRRRLDLAPPEAAAEVPDPSSAEQGATADDAARAVAATLAALGPGPRAVLLLRVEHELSYEAIAERLGIEVGTVKSRLARARAALWQALADAAEEETS